MKIRATVPFPLGPNDVMSKDTAKSLIGKEAPATDPDHNEIGTSTIIAVEWHSETEVLLIIEMEISDGLRKWASG